MAGFEARMAKYEFVAADKPLLRVPPQLQPGEKKVIVNFQDESCLTVNEYKSRAWYAPFLFFWMDLHLFKGYEMVRASYRRRDMVV